MEIKSVPFLCRSWYRHSSIDVELLCKSVNNISRFYSVTNGYFTEEEISQYIDDEYNEENFIPAMRVTYNWLFGKHIEASVGANTDLHVIGGNDAAFQVTNHNKKLALKLSPEVELCNSFFVGVKVK